MEIKTRLGHASITTTLNVYGHLFKSLDERLAEALDATHREAEGQAENQEAAHIVRP
jgi:integrase